jgi:hypothetical protein
MVKDPVQHLNSKHQMSHPSIKSTFDKHLLDFSWMESKQVIPSLPFVDVVDGFRCTGCGQACLYKKNLSCDCRSAGHIFENAKVQRLAENGGKKHWVAVEEVERPMKALDPVVIQIEKVVRANKVIVSDPPLSHKELNLFFTQLGWFQNPTEIEDFSAKDLSRFLRHDSESKVWMDSLFSFFVQAFEWAEYVPAQVRGMLEYNGITEVVRKRYSSTWVRLMVFLRNLAREPLVATNYMKVKFPFAEFIPHLVNHREPGSWVFDLFELIMSEEYASYNNATVAEAMIWMHCFDLKNRTLRDPRYIEPLTSRIMKMFRVAIFVQSHRRAAARENEEMADVVKLFSITDSSS